MREAKARVLKEELSFISGLITFRTWAVCQKQGSEKHRLRRIGFDVIRGLIFDLDGTLVDSLPGITAALNHALEDFDLPTHPQKRVAGFVGDGMDNLVRRALREPSEERVAAVLELFKKHYREDWKNGTHPYDGMIDFLRDLSRQGYRLAVLSNKPHPFTVEIVEGLFPSGLFDPVRGHLPEVPRKPDPTSVLEMVEGWNLTPAEVAYVGDSTVDLATARAAGLTPFIFSWGYGTPSDAPLLHSVDDLVLSLASRK
jgi:phosphoglycolate phosphatase